jgi:hypothetical protein
MPACFTISTHTANPVKDQSRRKQPTTAEHLLNDSWGSMKQTLTCGELLQSSFTSQDLIDIGPW